MKIITDSSPPLPPAESAEKVSGKTAPDAKAQAPARTSPGADKVNLSPQATATPQQSEELRGKRIEAIKTALAAGTYQVDSRQVAEKMLAGHLDL